LLPCAKPLRAYCSGNCRVALFVELHFYNIVVLGKPARLYNYVNQGSI